MKARMLFLTGLFSLIFIVSVVNASTDNNQRVCPPPGTIVKLSGWRTVAIWAYYQPDSQKSSEGSVFFWESMIVTSGGDYATHQFEDEQNVVFCRVVGRDNAAFWVISAEIKKVQ